MQTMWLCLHLQGSTEARIEFQRTKSAPQPTPSLQVTFIHLSQLSFNVWYDLGPGAYSATNGFDQINKAMQSAKTLQQFGLDQFGIQLVKP